jgi:hypothetical protein
MAYIDLFYFSASYSCCCSLSSEGLDGTVRTLFYFLFFRDSPCAERWGEIGPSVVIPIIFSSLFYFLATGDEIRIKKARKKVKFVFGSPPIVCSS